MASRQPFIYGSLMLLRKLMFLLPHAAACALGGKIGMLVAFFSKNRVKAAEARCRKALGVDEKEAHRIVRASYKHFGIAAVEFMRLPIMFDKLESLVRVHGAENLDKAFEYGKGIMFITAHLGNWEYAAALFAKRGYPINGLVAEQRDDRITGLIEDVRVASKVKVLYKNGDLKKMISLLRKGELIAVPIDQDAREKGIIAPFLGIPASTPTGVAKLADKFDCKVVAGFCIRAEDGIYDFHILPAFEEAGGRRFGEDTAKTMEKCNDVISDWIRKYPQQWMWLYPRWESVEQRQIKQ